MSTIGLRIEWARLLAGRSSRHLGTLVGLYPTHLRFIERGQKGIGAETAIRIADVLGVSLDWLLQGRGADPTEESVRKAVAAAEATLARRRRRAA